MKNTKITLFRLCLLAFASLLFIQCEEDDTNSVQAEASNYYAGIEYGSDGADYLSPASSLSEGTVSPVGNGFEQLAWASYIQGIDQVFSNAASTLTSYEKNELGVLTKGSSLSTSLGIYAYDVVDESTLIAVGSPWYSIGSKALYLINTDEMAITKTVETPLGNSTSGDTIISTPTSATVVDDHLFVSYYTVNTDLVVVNENQAKVAVYSYPELELEKIITDDRASDIGRYYSEYGMVKDENGDIYTMSSSSFACGYYPTSTLKSSILKITNGTSEFAEDYYFDFETASEGYKLNDIYYVANGKAVVRMLKDDATSWATYSPYSENPVLEFGIVDLYNKTFTAITREMEMSGGGWNGVAFVEGTTAYVGVSNSSYSGIYVIDVEEATVSEGADIDGNYAKALLGL